MDQSPTGATLGESPSFLHSLQHGELYMTNKNSARFSFLFFFFAILTLWLNLVTKVTGQSEPAAEVNSPQIKDNQG